MSTNRPNPGGSKKPTDSGKNNFNRFKNMKEESSEEDNAVGDEFPQNESNILGQLCPDLERTDPSLVDDVSRDVTIQDIQTYQQADQSGKNPAMSQSPDLNFNDIRLETDVQKNSTYDIPHILAQSVGGENIEPIDRNDESLLFDKSLMESLNNLEENNPRDQAEFNNPIDLFKKGKPEYQNRRATQEDAIDSKENSQLAKTLPVDLGKISDKQKAGGFEESMVTVQSELNETNKNVENETSIIDNYQKEPAKLETFVESHPKESAKLETKTEDLAKESAKPDTKTEDYAKEQDESESRIEDHPKEPAKPELRDEGLPLEEVKPEPNTVNPVSPLNFENDLPEKGLNDSLLEDEPDQEFGILYESYFDEGLRHKIAKIQYKSHLGTKILNSITTESLYTVGFFGDLEICAELASKFLDKNVTEQIEKLGLKKKQSFEGIFVSKHNDKAAFIMKTPDTNFSTERLNSQKPVVSLLRYLFDICRPIVIAFPKEYVSPVFKNKADQANFEMTFSTRNLTQNENTNTSLKLIQGSFVPSSVSPWELNYSNDLSYYGFTYTSSKIENKSEKSYPIDSDQLGSSQENFSDTNIQMKTFDEIKEIITEKWPFDHKLFYSSESNITFSNTFEKLFTRLIKNDQKTALDELIAVYQAKIDVKYKEFEISQLLEKRNYVSNIHNEIRVWLNDATSKLMNQSFKEALKNKKETVHQEIVKGKDIYLFLKQVFPESYISIAFKFCSSKWTLQNEGITLWNTFKVKIAEKARKEINEIDKNYSNLKTEFHKEMIDEFFEKVDSILNKEPKLSYKHSIVIKLYYLSFTNQAERNNFSYRESPKRFIIEFPSDENCNYSVADVLFRKDDQVEVVVKSEKGAKPISGKFRNDIFEHSLEIVNLDSQNTKIVANIENDRFVVYDNYCKVFKTGTLDKGNKKRSEVVRLFTKTDSSPEIEMVNSVTLLPKSNSIFLMNETGNLIHLKMKDKIYEWKFVESPNDLSGAKLRSSDPSGNFESLQGSPDGKTLFLQSKSGIDVFDLDFNHIQFVKFKHDFKSYKVFQVQKSCYLQICYSNDFELYELIGFKGDDINIRTESNDLTRELGNNYLDYVYYAYQKFGPFSSFLGCPEKGEFIAYNQNEQNEEDIFKEYFEQLEIKKASLKEFTEEEKLIKHLNKNAFKLDKKTLEHLMISRVPIHVASIKNFNLEPLKNGRSVTAEIKGFLDMHRDTDTMTAFRRLIGFGIYETFLSSYKEEVYVVSIFGEQNQGKSYFINRLFGARFDVSADRCTEGIWMSLAMLKCEQRDRLFIVLDCEGLSSSKRQLKDEKKLVAVTTAISNLSILNSNRSSNVDMMNKISGIIKDIDQKQSSQIFKGYLLYLIRDVSTKGDAQADGKVKAIYLSTTKDIDKENDGKWSLVLDYFPQGNAALPINSFDAAGDPFTAKINVLRDERIRKTFFKTHWKTGKQLIDFLKHYLTSVFFDDTRKIDEEQINEYLKENIKFAVQKFYNIDQSESKLFQFEFNVGGMQKSVEIQHSEIPVNQKEDDSQDPAEKIKSLKDLCHKEIPERVEFHNERIIEFQRIANQFYNSRIELVINLFEESSKSTINFFKDLNKSQYNGNAILERMKNTLKDILIKMINNSSFCQGKCQECDRLCKWKKGHPLECNCGTDHTCRRPCTRTDFCRENRHECIKHSGHNNPEDHVCDEKDHTCNEKCKEEDCENPCTEKVAHSAEQPHNCNKIHYCKETCREESCKRACMFDRTLKHEHLCSQKMCMHKCSLCDNTCMFPDHFHNDLITLGQEDKLKIRINDNEIVMNYHICANETHKCPQKCEQKGICKADYIHTTATFTNSFGTKIIDKFDPLDVRINCSHRIPKGLLQHKSEHHCKPNSDEKHQCKEKCPDCISYCGKDFEHEGLHSVAQHRNKKDNVFATTMVDKIIVLGSGSQVQKYFYNDSCEPETCISLCKNLGRGHFHILECKGIHECLKNSTSRGRHSTETFHPFEGKVFDKYLCEDYWKIQGWEPPLSKDELDNVKKCSIKCGNVHKENIEYFCKKNAWHENLHSFDCSHPKPDLSKTDIVFVCDATNSMNCYLDATVKTIERLMEYFTENFKDKAQVRYAFVSYKDHDKNYDPNKKETLKIDFTTAEEVIDFIEHVEADGGDDGPEAVVDGLDEATGLSWRTNSCNFLFHIADAPPHGKLYWPAAIGDNYPNGCPCGKNIENIAEKLNLNNVRYKLLKIGNALNFMTDIFSRHINCFEACDLICGGSNMDRLVLNVISNDSKVVCADHKREKRADETTV